MKFLVGVFGFLAISPAFGYQLRCVNDYRAVDGGFQEVVLQFDAETGRGQAVFTERADSPAASHEEKSTLRALTCKDNSSAGFRSVSCEGPFSLTVSEMELVGGPNGAPFSRKVMVNTSFQDKGYEFGAGAISNGATKSGCETK